MPSTANWTVPVGGAGAGADRGDDGREGERLHRRPGWREELRATVVSALLTPWVSSAEELDAKSALPLYVASTSWLPVLRLLTVRVALSPAQRRSRCRRVRRRR